MSTQGKSNGSAWRFLYAAVVGFVALCMAGCAHVWEDETTTAFSGAGATPDDVNKLKARIAAPGTDPLTEPQLDGLFGPPRRRVDIDKNSHIDTYEEVALKRTRNDRLWVYRYNEELEIPQRFEATVNGSTGAVTSLTFLTPSGIESYVQGFGPNAAQAREGQSESDSKAVDASIKKLDEEIDKLKSQITSVPPKK